METYVKVCMKSDWTMFFKEESLVVLKKAMKDKEVVELYNLFGVSEVVNGEDIATAFVSTVESRALYLEFEKMIEAEDKEIKPSWE